MTKTEFLDRIRGLRRPIQLLVSPGGTFVMAREAPNPTMLRSELKTRFLSQHLVPSMAPLVIERYRRWLDEAAEAAEKDKP